MLCILTRLPVKSIFRFKSVCKPWRELFSARDFMKMHRGQFSSDPRNHSVIIQSETEGRTMSLLNIESDENKPTILDHPCPETYLMNIVGCCNGLICMGLPGPGLGPDDIVLWNPAMKLFKFVGLSRNVDFMDPERGSLGFGYDAVGDDFKVVRFLCLEDQRGGEGMTIDRVEVYSVNSDSWITILNVGFQFRVFDTENIAIVDGNPYWFAIADERDSCVWFDVRKMVFKVVPLATHNFNVWEMTPVLVDWKGSLGAIVHTMDNERVHKSIDVWVFDDGEQIWIKNHTFRPIEMKLGCILRCWKNGKLLCSKDGTLFVFDPETGWVKFCDELSEIDGYLYTASLTYIKGLKQVEGRKRKRKREIIDDGASRSN